MTAIEKESALRAMTRPAEADSPRATAWLTKKICCARSVGSQCDWQPPSVSASGSTTGLQPYPCT